MELWRSFAKHFLFVFGFFCSCATGHHTPKAGDKQAEGAGDALKPVADCEGQTEGERIKGSQFYRVHGAQQIVAVFLFFS